MTGNLHRTVARLAIAAAIFVLSPIAHGQVYKCTDADGRTTYGDSRCASGGKSLRLPNDSVSSSAGPTVCAQMLDEMRRLATEDKRTAKRANGSNPDNARRHRLLEKQYRARCAAIRRSDSERPR